MTGIATSALGDGQIIVGNTVHTDHIGAVGKVGNHIGIRQSGGTITSTDDEGIAAIAPPQSISTSTAIEGVVVVTTIEFVVTSSSV